MALLTLNDKPIALKGSGGEMISLEVKPAGPFPPGTKPSLWYFDGEGVKQAEAFNTTIQCFKNSLIVIVGSPTREPVGMNILESFQSTGENIGSAKLYQIIDNGQIELF